MAIRLDMSSVMATGDYPSLPRPTIVGTRPHEPIVQHPGSLGLMSMSCDGHETTQYQSRQKCLVCAKTSCSLRSHQRFAKHIKPRSVKLEYRSQLLLQGRGTSKADPFAQYPIELTPELDQLLSQTLKPWNSDFKGPERHLYPTPRHKPVLDLARTDAALLIAALSRVATQTSLLRTGKVDQFSLELQQRAIQLQAQACQRNMTDDARIVAALCIMSNQIAGGNASVMFPHMRAIASSVQHRGGIQYLGMDGLVADNVMFADHALCVTLNVRPNYPLSLPSLQPEESEPLFQRHLGYRFQVLWARDYIDKAVYDCARDLSLLVDIYNHAAAGESTEKAATYFTYLASITEFQLAEINARNHDKNTIQELVILALALINHTIIRNYGICNPLMSTLETRFWRCFRHLLTRGLPEIEVENDLLLWLAFTGTTTQTRRTCDYVQDSVSIIVDARKRMSTSISTLKDVKNNILDPYLWSQPVQQHLYQVIWQRVLEAEGTSPAVSQENWCSLPWRIQ